MNSSETPTANAANDQPQTLGSGLHLIRLQFLPDANDNPLQPPIASIIAGAYLYFEQIIGHGAPPIYDIYLNVPEGEAESDAYYAGSLSFFGIEDDTSAAGAERHGQCHVLDVSRLLLRLRLSGNWNDSYLTIHLLPCRPMPDDAAASIGRVRLFCR